MDILEPAKRIPIAAEADTVVCGGGPAGFCAAIASARNGARTILIEQYGFSGGAMTVSGINGIGGFQHDIGGQPLIAGLVQEIFERLAEMGAADPGIVKAYYTPIDHTPDYINAWGLGSGFIRVSPEYFKILADRMLEEAGVEVCYHTLATDVLKEENRVKGVFIESKSGREVLLAKTVIDCTGDGDLAVRAGADFDMGRASDGAWQPHSMLFTVANTGEIYLNYDDNTDESDRDPLVRQRYRKAVALAREKGEIRYNPNDIFCAATPVDSKDTSVKTVNFTRIQHSSSVDRKQLTEAEILGRKQVLEGLEFMHHYVENSSEASLIGLPPAVGIRESRRITGDYILTGQDIEEGKRFDDVIARGIYLMDIHNATEVGKPSVLHKLRQPYDIPYRCLLPKGIEGLLVAGRCISGDSEAMSSYRIMTHCMAMGEAAGTAAALAASGNRTVRELPTELLQEQLIREGVNLGR